MRQKLNKTDDIARIDALKAREDLRAMKEQDYEEFQKKKRLLSDQERIVDKEYIDRQMALEEGKIQAEVRKREVGWFDEE